MFLLFFFKQSCSFVKCYFVGMTASAITISQWQQFSAWVYTGLGLSTVNHRWMRGLFGPIPLCWSMIYWWILWGRGRHCLQLCTPDELTMLQWISSKLMLYWQPLLSLVGHKTERHEYEKGTPQEGGWKREHEGARSQNTLHICTELLQEQI